MSRHFVLVCAALISASASAQPVAVQSDGSNSPIIVPVQDVIIRAPELAPERASAPTRLQSRFERLATRAESSRLSLKVAFLAGAMSYTGNYVEIRERRNRETGRTELVVVDEWQENLAIEPQVGLDLFMGVRVNADNGLLKASLGYEAIVTATNTSLMHRHLLSLRLANGLIDLSGGAGLLVWNHYQSMDSQLGFAAFFEVSIPFGRNGWFVALPVTMEWFVGTDLTGASGSLSIGWASF